MELLNAGEILFNTIRDIIINSSINISAVSTADAIES
jgi:hypothetical protein